MSLKSAIKGRVTGLRRGYERAMHAFSQADLVDALRRLGIVPGDTILVHSAYDEFTGFEGKPSDVIQSLAVVLGETGTLAMPTIPFSGTAVEYANSGTVFDVRRTPARVGLLPELFRRTPGVLRSVHPTHPVAAKGARAHELVADHASCETPCGASTPYARLLDMNGKSVFLGADISSFTFFHHLEALLETRMPFTPFTASTYAFTCRDVEGREVIVRNRLFDPAVSRRRNIGKLAAALKAAGRWTETRVGRVTLIAVSARDALGAANALADRGEFCYDD